jgi:mono/diheme cytochrome c family protein
MSRSVRLLALLLGMLLALVLLGAGGIWIASERVVRRVHEPAMPPFDVDLPTDSASIAEGERIARTRGCFGCHGARLEGRVFMSEPLVATLVAPNLTARVAEYSNAELERAIRQGYRRNGELLYGMPSEMYHELNDDDTARLMAFLRSRPRVEGERTVTSLGPLGRVGLLAGQFQSARHYIETESPPPPPGDSALRLGYYVARTSCTECHGNELAGDGEGTPALGPMAVSYTPEAFAGFLRNGVAMGGRELPLMSRTARGRFAYLTAEELASLYAYLRSLVRSTQASTR